MNTKFFALPYEVEGKTYFTYLNLKHIISIDGAMVVKDATDEHTISIKMSDGEIYEVNVPENKPFADFLVGTHEMLL